MFSDMSRISDVIIRLAEMINSEGDKELPEDFLIRERYGEIVID